MYNTNIFRLAACAMALALAAASSFAVAAEGANCAVRVAGPQGQSGATLGHVNADGKCVVAKAVAPAATKQAATKTKEDDGLEASAQCRDLSFSYSKRRDSACAKHGGVLEWLAQQ